MYRSATINKQLKDLLEKTVKEYRDACQGSRMDVMETLPPGARVPEKNRIHTDSAREDFRIKCMDNYQKAQDIFSEVKKDLNKELTAAPSTDAVNTITLLKTRGKDLTPGEVGALLDAYGNNVQAYRSILAIAREHDIHEFFDHPLDSKMQEVESLERAVNSTISAQAADNGTLNGGFVAWTEMMIDGVFPEE